MVETKCEICGKPIIFRGSVKDYTYKIKYQGQHHFFCSHTCHMVGEQMREKIHVDIKPLVKARNLYGDINQLAVCVEELSELAKVLAKYFRYDRETALEKLREDAIDEVADVYIILEHVKNIFNLRNGEVNQRIDAKLERLQRWISTSNDFSYTMEDREV